MYGHTGGHIFLSVNEWIYPRPAERIRWNAGRSVASLVLYVDFADRRAAQIIYAHLYKCPEGVAAGQLGGSGCSAAYKRYNHDRDRTAPRRRLPRAGRRRRRPSKSAGSGGGEEQSQNLVRRPAAGLYEVGLRYNIVTE